MLIVTSWKPAATRTASTTASSTLGRDSCLALRANSTRTSTGSVTSGSWCALRSPVGDQCAQSTTRRSGLRSAGELATGAALRIEVADLITDPERRDDPATRHQQ